MAAAPAAPNGIILFHYAQSPVSRQVVWYLTLLGIPYAECIQPQWLPRPDLEALNIAYRRIPLMAIGRDIYCDSRIILRRISQLYPSVLLPQSPEHVLLQQLIEKWTQGVVFGQAASLLPVENPAMQNVQFRKDREEMTGRTFDVVKYPRGYAEGRVNLREAFDMLEGVLGDGREFLLGTEGPTLVDIEAIFPFQWVATDPGMRSALPPDYISSRQFPRVYAWIQRFQTAFEAAKSRTRRPIKLNGKEALESISKHSQLGNDETQGSIDANDPLGLEAGTLVDVYPIDTGFRNKDRGQLVTLTGEEVAVRKRTSVMMARISLSICRGLGLGSCL